MIDLLHSVSKQNEAGTLITANRPLHHERRTLAHRVPNPCHLRSACQETSNASEIFRAYQRGNRKSFSLVSGSSRGWMLEIYRANQRFWIRNHFREPLKDKGSPSVIPIVCGSYYRRNAGLSQVRQSSVCESRSPFCGNEPRQYRGPCSEGTVSSRRNVPIIEIQGRDGCFTSERVGIRTFEHVSAFK